MELARLLRVGLVVSVTAAQAACVVVPATNVKISGEISTASVEPGSGRKIAAIFSSDFAPQTSLERGDQLVGCIGKAARDGLPGVTVLSPELFYAAIFPGLTPEQVLIRRDTISPLFTRPDIGARVEKAGLDFLVLVEDKTLRQSDAALLGLGAVGGWGTSADMTTTLVDLRHGREVGKAHAEATGQVFWIAPLLIPMGGGVDPVAPTCRAVAEETLRLIRGTSEGHR